jgi:hypothetical protein
MHFFHQLAFNEMIKKDQDGTKKGTKIPAFLCHKGG